MNLVLPAIIKTRKPFTLSVKAKVAFLLVLNILLILVNIWIYYSANSKVFANAITKSGILPEPYSSSPAWADFDSDGDQDLLITYTGRGLKLYKNNGDGTFTNVTSKSGLPANKSSFSAAFFGDYDNDGCLDLYISSFDSDKLYHSNCDETFSDVSVQAGIRDMHHGLGLSWVDYNKDGFLDIYVVNHGTGRLENFHPETNILYRNNGDGTFTDVTEAAGVRGFASCPNLERNPKYVNRPIPPAKQSFQSLWADFNSDSWPDFYVTNDAAVDVFYLNNQDGTFSDATYKSGLCNEINWSGMGVAAGDFDGDEDLDIYITNSGSNFLYQNDGQAKFIDVAEKMGVADIGNGWGTEFIDYDNDGDQDLLVVNGTWPDYALEIIKKSGGLSSLDLRAIDRLYENKGGSYIDVTAKVGLKIVTGQNKLAAATADYNNDGFVDLYIAPTDNFEKGAGYLYRNTPNGNHWLTVQLVGTKSNRDAVGARIILKSGGKTQIREIISGSSYMGQSSLWQTFGLGKFSKADEIEIRWPSGEIQSLKNVRSNQKIVIKE